MTSADLQARLEHRRLVAAKRDAERELWSTPQYDPVAVIQRENDVRRATAALGVFLAANQPALERAEMALSRLRASADAESVARRIEALRAAGHADLAGTAAAK